MNKIYKIIIFSAILISVFGFVYLNHIKPTSADTSTCKETQIFWRLPDGTAFTAQPQAVAVGDTIQAVAKFQNCNGIAPTFTAIDPSGQKAPVTVSTVTSDSETEEHIDFTFNNAGDNYFRVTVPNGTSYDSAHINVSQCNGNITFDANPKQVDSLSQTITLTATVNVPAKGCNSIFGASLINGDLNFYHGSSQLIKTVSETSVSLVGDKSITETVTTTAQNLGYQLKQNISFSANFTGNVVLQNNPIVVSITKFPLNLISSPVNVGVGQAPSALTKYQCTNKACVLDTNGPYNSLEICNNACGTGTTASGSAGTTQTFNIANPIGISTFQDLVGVIGTWIFNLAIPIAVIIIIYAGILMLTAGPNPANFKKGRDALKYAVIGLAVVLIGKGFVSLIQSILNLKNG